MVSVDNVLPTQFMMRFKKFVDQSVVSMKTMIFLLRNVSVKMDTISSMVNVDNAQLILSMIQV